jgi:hypothetical protein
MTDEELVKALRWKAGAYAKQAADRIEQLVAINEAARADAKEAEAYAEELERDLNICRMAQVVMDNTVAELEKENTRLSGLMSERGQMLRRYDQMVVDGAKREEAWKAKLAKAVEAAEEMSAAFYSDGNVTERHLKACKAGVKLAATLAEIKGGIYD